MKNELQRLEPYFGSLDINFLMNIVIADLNIPYITKQRSISY